jgi:hypothetical protein
MSADNTGVSAFPCGETIDMLTSKGVLPSRGISIRDYFAAHCPISLDDAAAYFRESKDERPFMEFFCETRLPYADAMLKARQS